MGKMHKKNPKTLWKLPKIKKNNKKNKKTIDFLQKVWYTIFRVKGAVLQAEPAAQKIKKSTWQTKENVV